MKPAEHQIKKALISVSDKTGIIEFAKRLSDLGIEIISTGGTYKTLSDNGINAKQISEITNFPEILDGRVKTLHPKIHGGLLAELDKEEHIKQMQAHEIESIDLLIVNLYPFEKTLANPNSTFEDIIENIDIGGPGMIRAAAKNYKWTLPLVNPDMYESVLEELKANGNRISEETRFKCAAEVYAHTARYDSIISNFFSSKLSDELPDNLAVGAKKEASLRYGENPHQKAALYGNYSSIYNKLHGKELSYNNIVDIDSAVKIALNFDAPTVAIIKHNNPCGVGSAPTVLKAFQKAFATDTSSPYGGIVALNKPFTKELAELVHPIFMEVLIAPEFEPEALEILTKKRDRRLLTYNFEEAKKALDSTEIKVVLGGYLTQKADSMPDDETQFKVVSKRQPTQEEMEAALFAWKIVKRVKSNAIVFTEKDRTLGIGGGQTSRVESAKIAVAKAKEFGHSLANSACASDAYFPFADGLGIAIEAGATVAIQPGGSIHDKDVIELADKEGIAMIFTGVRHFWH